MKLSPFVSRHIGNCDKQVATILNNLGYTDLEAFSKAVIPEQIYQQNPPLDLVGCDEQQALDELYDIMAKNKLNTNFIGLGFYGTSTPQVIIKNLFENPSFYSAYTPYQSEISQGRLELLLYFQQMIIDLTALEVANASLLDEATAAAEAMMMLWRANKQANPLLLIDQRIFAQNKTVIETRAIKQGIEIVIGEADQLIDQYADKKPFGLILQQISEQGEILAIDTIIEKAHQNNILVAVGADLLASTILKAAGELAADIVFGLSQRFGVPMGFGGPHAAFIACHLSLQRLMPGRIIGVSKDTKGKTALRMAMQTREQHIRRDKATSNICTAQALLAMMAVCYAIYHGPKGIKNIAQTIHLKTIKLASILKQKGFKLKYEQFFDTICIQTDNAQKIVQNLAKNNINVAYLKKHPNQFQITIDETHDDEDIENLIDLLVAEKIKLAEIETDKSFLLLPSYQRKSQFLTHSCFNNYHSEVKMTRFLHHLAQKDIALNFSMIPLGSCTMKLNAASELKPLSWKKVALIHPFAPSSQTLGYQKMIDQLQYWLAKICGFDACSIMPNAGSQGEFAGLIAISAYHQSKNQANRNICLIPQSAHGTNPASAILAGMKVVVVNCDQNGNIDIEDLKEKIAIYKNDLAAMMITYPSTHGVFESKILEISNLVHQNGGQIYLDGANLNAQLGLVKIADFADVCHYNLHKTFAIPHGGGGPGVGPIGLKSHLVPFAPGHIYGNNYGISADRSITSTIFGSASILTISWMYIRMMGSMGLKKASQIAVLNANFVANELKDDYPILYKGKNNLVAHECILDLRKIKHDSLVSDEDIAKRLIDFGFHAPTMSFPVAGTLMIEPTESEDLQELTRFCLVMKTIRQEIKAIEQGKISLDESMLKNAPHTLADICAENWDRKYSKTQAAFALDYLKTNKYFSSVNRVDNVFGDRNLVCNCQEIQAYR